MTQIPTEAFARAVQIANEAGLRGRKVEIVWIPPATASSDPLGSFAVVDVPPKTTSE